MTEEEKREQIDFIKKELGSFTKTVLVENLNEKGIKASENAKKDILLEMLAKSIVDEEARKTAEKEENREKRADTLNEPKKPAQSKKGGKSRAPRNKHVPELTKKRRANVKGIKKAISSVEVEGNSNVNTYIEEEPELEEVKSTPNVRERYKDSSLRDEDYELLESFNSSNIILTGTMEFAYIDPRGEWKTKTHPRTKEEGRYYQIAAVIRYKSRFVYIPAEYFLENYYDLDQRGMKRFIENRQGATVDFRVISANAEDPEAPFYIGSRIDAMVKLRKDNWYSDRARGQSLVQVGSIHEARVSAVGQKQLFLELYGVEVPIPTRYVSYTEIDDLTEIYLPGDTEKVMIKSVALADRKRAEVFNYPVDCTFSVREAKDDPRDKYFVQDLSGMKFRGVVRNIAVNGKNEVKYFVEVGGHQENIDKKADENITISCALYHKIEKIPRKGAIVSGTITFSNDRQKRMFGTIYHIDRQGRE